MGFESLGENWRKETAGPSTTLRSGRDDKGRVGFPSVNAANRRLLICWNAALDMGDRLQPTLQLPCLAQ